MAGPPLKYQRLDAWGRGQAVALAEEGDSSHEIAQRVRKPPTGRRLGSHPDPRSVRHLVLKAREDPKYRGQSPPGPGRRPRLTDRQQPKLVELVFKHRGGSVVTSTFCQNQLLSATQSNSIVGKCCYLWYTGVIAQQNQGRKESRTDNEHYMFF